MKLAFHVQYGLSRHVGRFLAEANGGPFAPGQDVVVKTSRGTELGRIVAVAKSKEDLAPILRSAGPDDFNRARLAEFERHRRFDECRRVFDEGIWPIEPIDVEPLLDEGRAVLHYLGPHKLDVSGLSDALRSACGLDLIFEPVGLDLPDEQGAEETAEEDHGCGSCGSGGGCGTGGGCATTGAGGCTGCSVSDLVTSRRRSSLPA